jgi:hypothetical protein
MDGVAAFRSSSAVGEVLLHELYKQRNLSIREVGEAIGLGLSTVSRLLDRYGVAKCPWAGVRVVDGRVSPSSFIPRWVRSCSRSCTIDAS